jgi:hypothetical protein
MTKQQLIKLCKEQNPVLTQVVNGEQIELVGQDYEAACEAWAEMRLEQIAKEQADLEIQASRKALLDRLGITEEEAKLLLA